MADQKCTLHYGAQKALELAEDWDTIARRVHEQISAGGGWVDAMTTEGGVTFYAAPGIPILFMRPRAAARPAVTFIGEAD